MKRFLIWLVVLVGLLGVVFLASSVSKVEASPKEPICHVTPGNSVTIYPNENSYDAHLEDSDSGLHGEDYFGQCEGEPRVPYVHVDRECGGGLTFRNPTNWLFVFDVRVDDEDSLHGSVAPGVKIHEGPLDGQEFGPRWRLVVVDGRVGQHEAFLPWTDMFGEDTGVHQVEYRLAEGAEQMMYFDWITLDEIESNCKEDEVPQPEPVPTPVVRGLTQAGAPQCNDGNILALPLNVQVVRAGAEATVKWIPTGGNLVNIYLLDGKGDLVGAEGDVANDGEEVIDHLNPTADYSFELEQHQGCGGGERVRVGVIDSYLPMTFYASYWVWSK